MRSLVGKYAQNNAKFVDDKQIEQIKAFIKALTLTTHRFVYFF